MMRLYPRVVNEFLRRGEVFHFSSGVQGMESLFNAEFPSSDTLRAMDGIKPTLAVAFCGLPADAPQDALQPDGRPYYGHMHTADGRRFLTSYNRAHVQQIDDGAAWQIRWDRREGRVQADGLGTPIEPRQRSNRPIDTTAEQQIADYADRVRSAIAANPNARVKALAEAEKCRQSFLDMQAHGDYDMLCSIRDENTYEAIRRAVPDANLPPWSDAIAQIRTSMSDAEVIDAVAVAGYTPRHGTTQLWEPCPKCGQEPIYLETGLCESCEEAN
jgi:hypothetical protein